MQPHLRKYVYNLSINLFVVLKKCRPPKFFASLLHSAEEQAETLGMPAIIGPTHHDRWSKPSTSSICSLIFLLGNQRQRH